MWYLLGEIFFCLLLAALLGSLIGWWVRSRRCAVEMKQHEAELRSTIERVEEEREAVQREMADLYARTARLQGERDSAATAIASLEADLAAREQHLALQSAELNAKTDELAATSPELELARKTMESAQAAVAQLSDHRDALRTELDDANEEVRRLKAYLASLEAQLPSDPEVSAANAVAGARLAAEAKSLRARVADLEGELAARVPSDSSSRQVADDGGPEELDRARQSIERLEADLEVAQRRCDELVQDREKRIAQLERTVSLQESKLSLPKAPDDLKRIKGIGAGLESLLNGLGVHYFLQIAHWDEADIAWAAAKLDSFPDRIERDDWIGQARRFHEEEHGEED